MSEGEPSAKRQRTEESSDVHGATEAAEPNADAEAVVTAALHELDVELEKLAEDEAGETKLIDRKYRALRADVYKRRAAVFADVEQFWLIAMTNSSLQEYISEWDKSILQYLSSLDIQEDPDNDNAASFAVTLHFSTNPVFKNTALTRTSVPGEGASEMVVSCTPVEWHDGQDLTKVEAEDGSGPLIQLYTFLQWFILEGTYTIEEGADVDPIAGFIRDEVWLHPLECYNREPGEEMATVYDASRDGEGNGEMTGDAAAGDSDAPDSDDEASDMSGSDGDGDEGVEAVAEDDEEEEDAL